MSLRLSAKKQGSGKARRNSHWDEPRREWPAERDAYELLEEAGRGGAAVVYRARCVPLDEIVAVKITNLEDADLAAIAAFAREATLMRRFSCPNILTLHTSFVAGAELWMVMPIMAGSARAIMKARYPEGLSEVVIATICREVLKGLEYVHKHGGIHRDVKAANILIGSDGSCQLADFGIATTMRTHSPSAINLSCAASAGMHRTFIGTPCWIAPEVIQSDEGYHTAADIWSLGITLLELASGRPPAAKLHPMRILSETINAPAPTLSDVAGAEAAAAFSKHFHDLVGRCLEKEPSARPSASELLQHKFIKQARDQAYLQTALVAPPTLSRSGSGKRSGSSKSSAKDIPLARGSGPAVVAAWSAPAALSRPGVMNSNGPAACNCSPHSPLAKAPSPLSVASVQQRGVPVVMTAVEPLPVPGDPPAQVLSGGREKSGWLFDSQLLKNPPSLEALFPAISEDNTAPDSKAAAAAEPALQSGGTAGNPCAAPRQPTSPRVTPPEFHQALQARLRASSPRSVAGTSLDSAPLSAGMVEEGQEDMMDGDCSEQSLPCSPQQGALAWLVGRLRLSSSHKSGSSANSSSAGSASRRQRRMAMGRVGSGSNRGSVRGGSVASSVGAEPQVSREAVAAIFGAAPGLAWRGAEK